MAQLVRYADPDGAWSETLTTKRPEELELEESAEFAQAAMAKVVVDDDDATLGHDGDAIRGLQVLEVLETSAPVGDQRVWTGATDKRWYRRSANFGTVGANAREIEIAGVEGNALMSDHVLHGSGAANGNRPRESAAVRLAWILASGYVDCEDRGKVVYPSVMMEKNDYRGQRGGDVLADIATVAKYDFTTLLDDEGETVPELFFDAFDRSTVYTTTAKISNAGDDDGTTIFAPIDPGEDEKLERDPENVGSGGYGTWEKGNVYETKASTAAAFRSRDFIVSSSQAKTAAAARRLVRQQLDEHDEETDRLSLAFECAPADVNKIRRGHRLEVCVTFAPGYESYRWVRVLSRRVTMPAGHDLLYRVDVIVTPMAGAICGDAVDILEAHATISAAIGVESGSSVWAHASIPGWFGSPLDDPVTLIPILNPTNANDGDTTSYAEVPAVVLRNSGTVAAYFVAELDATYSICSLEGTNAVGSVSWRSFPPDRIEYWDGAAWVVIGGGYTYTDPLPSPQYWQHELATAVETSKLRFVWLQTGVGGILGLWNWFSLGVRVYDLRAKGVAV